MSQDLQTFVVQKLDEIIEVLKNLEPRSKHPDDFAKALLDGPIIRLADKTNSNATLMAVRDFLRRNQHRIYGINRRAPAESWVAEVAPPFLLMEAQVFLEAILCVVSMEQGAAQAEFVRANLNTARARSMYERALAELEALRVAVVARLPDGDVIKGPYRIGIKLDALANANEL